jgi:predicted Zn-dependent protease
MNVIGRLSKLATPGVALFLASCAVNPATGERMFSLVSESQEIQMGRESHPSIVGSMGLYEDEEVQAYFDELGQRMAAISERPELPWEFTVLDDPLINAFALPGGFIYMTRGIMVYMRSEAEFVGVLGHEIGHVTARHSVEQISRQQLLQVGAGVGMILSPQVRANAALVGQTLQLVTLKFGRDDEMQSDDLGLRYMTALGYDPYHHASVFSMLGTVTSGAGEEIPEWFSTHPNPENREGRILEEIRAREAAGEDFSDAIVGRDRFMRILDGMVFGANPREGFFDEGVFHHPDLRFRLEFPAGWRTQNTKQNVAAISSEQDAVLVLSMAENNDPAGALSDFLGAEGIEAGQPSSEPINGLPAARAEFRVDTEQGPLRGQVAYIKWGDLTYELLGYAPESVYSSRASRMTATIGSFREETDPEILSVTPDRLEIVTLPSAMTAEEFLRRYPSVVDDETVLNLNRVGESERLSAGTPMKRVVN